MSDDREPRTGGDAPEDKALEPTGEETAAGSSAVPEEPVEQSSIGGPEPPDAPEQPAPPVGAPEDDTPGSDAPLADSLAAPGEEPSADAPSQPSRRPRPTAAGDSEAKPAAIPGADLIPDIVPEGIDPLGPDQAEPDTYDEDTEPPTEAGSDEADDAPAAQPIANATIDLGAQARYRATGKRKTAVGRIILRPGKGDYRINGKTLNEYFPRPTLQRNIRQPLETVGYQERMDVVGTLHGGGVSAQAGALRHGISRALLEADPNLRSELKRRGFLTRDARAKERKKAGLKKARKRPQFSKR